MSTKNYTVKNYKNKKYFLDIKFKSERTWITSQLSALQAAQALSPSEKCVKSAARGALELPRCYLWNLSWS
jgi:hypothetical protein